jgi:RNA polymerase sigma-70 factor (ECF subfamily)
MDRFTGAVGKAPYFANYSRWPIPWRLAVGEVDGEPMVVVLYEAPGGWKPKAAVRLEVIDHRVARIADYIHCPWILPAAASVVVAEPFPN